MVQTLFLACNAMEYTEWLSETSGYTLCMNL